MKTALVIRESRSEPFFFPRPKIKRSDADVKINMNKVYILIKEYILILIIPIFISIMLALEIFYAKDIYQNWLEFGVVVFLFQLGVKVGSIDKRFKGVSQKISSGNKKVNSINIKVNSINKKVKGIDSRLCSVETKFK